MLASKTNIHFLEPNWVSKIKHLTFYDTVHINPLTQRWSRWSLVFQVIFIGFEIFLYILSLLIVIIIDDLKQVFLVFSLLDSGINTYCKSVLALTLFLFIIASRIFLVVWIFFISLVDRKLFFLTRCINKGGVSKLILLKVFILLFC